MTTFKLFKRIKILINKFLGVLFLLFLLNCQTKQIYSKVNKPWFSLQGMDVLT